MSLEMLFSAALDAGLSLLAEAGFGDELRALKQRWLGTEEKKRRRAFDEVMSKAVKVAGEAGVLPILEDRSFQEELITGLLDPTRGMDFQAVAAAMGEQFQEHARTVRRFFSILENALLEDETWGPILERFHALRFQREVVQALKDRRLDLPSRELVHRLNARLEGSGALVQGEGVAAGAQGVAVGGDVQKVVQIFIQELIVSSGPQDAGASLRRRYLQELERDANILPWGCVTAACADASRDENLGLADVYTDLDTTELRQVKREEELRQFMARIHEAERLPVQEVANGKQRLLIMGDPGSGKSTFMKYVCYVLARAGLAEDPSVWLSAACSVEAWRAAAGKGGVAVRGGLCPGAQRASGRRWSAPAISASPAGFLAAGEILARTGWIASRASH